ncbi:MAG: hypothetical protein HYX90_11390 [Chloroflexi bacterium]|nr:hypothetical protein [Chloroflexota bacterium]
MPVLVNQSSLQSSGCTDSRWAAGAIMCSRPGGAEHKSYTYDSYNGKLVVVVVNLRGAERIGGAFSFVVYKVP